MIFIPHPNQIKSYKRIKDEATSHYSSNFALYSPTKLNPLRHYDGVHAWWSGFPFKTWAVWRRACWAKKSDGNGQDLFSPLLASTLLQGIEPYGVVPRELDIVIHQVVGGLCPFSRSINGFELFTYKKSRHCTLFQRNPHRSVLRSCPLRWSCFPCQRTACWLPMCVSVFQKAAISDTWWRTSKLELSWTILRENSFSADRTLCSIFSVFFCRSVLTLISLPIVASNVHMSGLGRSWIERQIRGSYDQNEDDKDRKSVV